MNKEYITSLLKREWYMPYYQKILRIMHSFSLTEKVIFFFLTILLTVSSLSLLWQVNKFFMVEVPDYGGSFTEGIIGSPRFINPVLSASDADKDLTALVYSGLLRVTPSGSLIPDLAESYTISDDGLEYTFVIKKNALFQDGTKVTADDILFTIEKAQDNTLKSPRKTSWDGVKVTKIDDRTVKFTLRQAYSPFIESTTLGILPKHIWKNASDEEFPFSQFNTKPVGSGPYSAESITFSSSGLPSEYHLVAFDKYALGKPYITHIVIQSYTSEKDELSAYKSGSIEGVHGASPQQVVALGVPKGDVQISPLPRVFGVFFNQNSAPVFVNKEVRQALQMVTNKAEIVHSVLGGYGQSIDEAIPPKVVAEKSEPAFADGDAIQRAQDLLTKNGWKKNSSGIFEKKDAKKNTTTLAFSISTGDAPELKATAEILQRQWQKLGAQVEVKIFEIGDLNQNVIRPRKYDSLLFGEVIGRDLDLYPFWHSSARTDPGLNIALYTNLKADKILENIRKTSDPGEQHKLYDSFSKEIDADTPAVFLYSPYFIYIVPETVHNVTLGQLTTPAERFSNVYQWYIETNNVWKIFAK